MQLSTTIAPPAAVIPAEAGIHLTTRAGREMDPRFRGDDAEWGAGVGAASAVEPTP